MHDIFQVEKRNRYVSVDVTVGECICQIQSLSGSKQTLRMCEIHSVFLDLIFLLARQFSFGQGQVKCLIFVSCFHCYSSTYMTSHIIQTIFGS